MKNLLNYTASVAFLIGVIFMTGFFDSNVFAQVSEVDATFNPAVTKDVTSNVTGNPVWQADGKTLIYGVFQTDGKILMYGDFNRVSGTIKNNFARVNADGTLDGTFDGGSAFDVAPREIVLQTDGKILVIGDFTTYNGTAKTRIARLNSDGSLDNSFNPTFNSSFLYSILPLANGKILVGGNFITIGNALRSGIARITVPAIQNVTKFDFDGDGKADFAVYRPSTGTWYVFNSSNGSSTILNFGISEDKPIAADYDGDGKADIAVFRPSTGVWYVQRSTAGFTALQFGVSTDVPTPNAFVP